MIQRTARWISNDHVSNPEDVLAHRLRVFHHAKKKNKEMLTLSVMFVCPLHIDPSTQKKKQPRTGTRRICEKVASLIFFDF
jgi:hypothetical protein